MAAPVKGELSWPTCLKREKQLQVIHFLVEGNSIRSIERLTGVQKKTVGRLLLKVGNACRELLDERLRDLTLDHVQVDEIWTFVQKKQARLTTLERAYRGDIGDMFLWVPLDPENQTHRDVRGWQAFGRHGTSRNGRPAQPIGLAGPTSRTIAMPTPSRPEGYQADHANQHGRLFALS